MSKYLFIALLMSLVALGFSVKSCDREHRERIRLEGNQNVLLEDVKYYRTRDSLSVASVERLVLTKNELERYNQELIRDAKSLKLKIRRIETASTTVINTGVSITTPLKDSTATLRQNDTLPVVTNKIQTFSWADAWVSVRGVIENKTVNCQVNSRDTIEQFIHRVPYQFLFFKYGTKAIKQEVLSKNPHSTIVYSEYIELKK